MGERSRSARPAIVAATGGLLLALAAPPFPVAMIVLAFVAAVLLAASLNGAPPRQAALRGLAFGVATNLVAMSFVPTTITRFTSLHVAVAMLGWILLSCAQGLSFAIGGWLSATLQGARVPLALSFAIGIGVAMFVPALFPWTIVAPFARAPVFLQVAELVGERGAAVILAIATALFAEGLLGARRRFYASAAVMAALLLYGVLRMATLQGSLAAAPRRTIALVQQAIPPVERWRPELAPAITTKLWSLTRVAEQQGADLTIWPESAYPYVVAHEHGRDGGAFPIRGPGIEHEILTGVLTHASPPPDAEPGSHWNFNAATIAYRDGTLAPAAAKIELLAFGEVVPLGDRFPVLRRTFSRGGGLVAGATPRLLRTESQPEVRAGILNCYEDTLPSVARRTSAIAPNLLVNVTNDAWFGATAEPELHMLEAITRTIEARRDLVRAVNTGVTAHIDATGRVVARAEREIATVLLVRPALLDTAPTLYVRVGDAAWIVPLVALAAGLALLARRRAV
jgi:apolipoprotein N-acyltransferase